MSARGVLRIVESGRLCFWCPGCKGSHCVRVATGRGDWGFNDNYDRPTFTPSVLVTYEKFTDRGEAAYQVWAKAGRPEPVPEFERQVIRRCHSFVRDGQIQFLGDCTHALAGKTVPLEPF